MQSRSVLSNSSFMWLFNFKDDTKFKIQFLRHTSHRSSAYIAAVAAAGVSGSEDAEWSREYRKVCCAVLI